MKFLYFTVIGFISFVVVLDFSRAEVTNLDSNSSEISPDFLNESANLSQAFLDCANKCNLDKNCVGITLFKYLEGRYSPVSNPYFCSTDLNTTVPAGSKNGNGTIAYKLKFGNKLKRVVRRPVLSLGNSRNMRQVSFPGFPALNMLNELKKVRSEREVNSSDLFDFDAENITSIKIDSLDSTKNKQNSTDLFATETTASESGTDAISQESLTNITNVDAQNSKSTSIGNSVINSRVDELNKTGESQSQSHNPATTEEEEINALLKELGSSTVKTIETSSLKTDDNLGSPHNSLNKENQTATPGISSESQVQANSGGKNLLEKSTTSSTIANIEKGKLEPTRLPNVSSSTEQTIINSTTAVNITSIQLSNSINTTKSELKNSSAISPKPQAVTSGVNSGVDLMSTTGIEDLHKNSEVTKGETSRIPVNIEPGTPNTSISDVVTNNNAVSINSSLIKTAENRTSTPFELSTGNTQVSTIFNPSEPHRINDESETSVSVPTPITSTKGLDESTLSSQSEKDLQTPLSLNKTVDINAALKGLGEHLASSQATILMNSTSGFFSKENNKADEHSEVSTLLSSNSNSSEKFEPDRGTIPGETSEIIQGQKIPLEISEILKETTETSISTVKGILESGTSSTESVPINFTSSEPPLKVSRHSTKDSTNELTTPVPPSLNESVINFPKLDSNLNSTQNALHPNDKLYVNADENGIFGQSVLDVSTTERPTLIENFTETPNSIESPQTEFFEDDSTRTTVSTIVKPTDTISGNSIFQSVEENFNASTDIFSENTESSVSILEQVNSTSGESKLDQTTPSDSATIDSNDSTEILTASTVELTTDRVQSSVSELKDTSQFPEPLTTEIPISSTEEDIFDTSTVQQELLLEIVELDKECKFEDRERFRRNILAGTYAVMDNEPVLITFVDDSPCIATFSKNGHHGIFNKKTFLPEFPMTQAVDAAAYMNDTLYLFDSEEGSRQKVYGYKYNAELRAYEPANPFVISQADFLAKHCGVIVSNTMTVKAFAQLSQDVNDCIIFDRTRVPMISEGVSSDTKSLAQAINAVLEAEFVPYAEAVFTWLDEPLSTVYVFGSDGELYALNRNASSGNQWVAGEYSTIPYSIFPV